jgi:transmembrane sensor
VALLLGATLVWRVTQTRTTPVVAARVYTTPVGRTDSVRFTDGSRAVLAPGTTLEVAAGYGGEIRSMELRGQALFDVVHDEKRPFTVGAGGALIEDLGTTFSVRSDDEDGVHVRVTSGSVLLQGRDDPKQGTAKPKPQTRKDEGVVLRAGERGTVGRDGRAMVERTTPAADDLAWTHGRLLFEDAPLSRVRSDIRRWYGVELQIADSSLANRHLTASFAGEPIEDVLNVIALALGARIERRGDTAVVRAK